MNKPTVLFLACTAFAACLSGGALYRWLPIRTMRPVTPRVAPPAPAVAAPSDDWRVANRQLAAQTAARGRAGTYFKHALRLPRPLSAAEVAAGDPGSRPKAKAVLSTSVLDKATIPNLAGLKRGEVIGLPLSDGRMYDGLVTVVKGGQGSAVRVGGSLMPVSKGSFSLNQHGLIWQGMVRLPPENRAFLIETRSDGRVVMQEHLLSDIECMGMPMKEGDPSAPLPINSALAAAEVPLLNTRPGARGVLYIDFDGELVQDSCWNNGNPIAAAVAVYQGAPLTETHITQVVETVAEDFAAFDLTVTTDRELYDQTAPGSRMRCIVTPTRSWNPTSAAGVAYLGSFAGAGNFFDDDVPCWCFGMYDPADMALVISHEAGHAFGLGHDGTSAPVQTYYRGHRVGSTSWGPLMGAPYGRKLTQWSRGEYPNADNTEDDIAIIAGAANGIGLAPDEAGPTILESFELPAPNGSFTVSGLINAADDVDFFRVAASAGPLVVTCASGSVVPNLGLVVEVYSADGILLGSDFVRRNAAVSLSAVLRTQGDCFIAVFAAGIPAEDGGDSGYGSTGTYILTVRSPASSAASGSGAGSAAEAVGVAPELRAGPPPIPGGDL